MYYKIETLSPWDELLVTTKQCDKDWLCSEKKRQKGSTRIPFLPSIHHVVDMFMGDTLDLWTKHTDCLKDCYDIANHSENYYTSKSVRKKNGDRRMLAVPCENLKEIQKCVLNNVLAYQPVSYYATAYRKGVPLSTNVLPHVGQPLILKLDISGFFANIRFESVYKSAFNTKMFSKAVGVLLAKMCCLNDVLPQGAPTSPAISNLVMFHFDECIGSWCSAQGIQYTRYCDDMTFSGAFNPDAVIGKVGGFLEAMGFSLNKRKTQIAGPGKAHLITGIIANEKMQTSATFRRQIRQEIYYCKKFGIHDHLHHARSFAATVDTQRYIYSLLGRINFSLQINPGDLEMQEYDTWLRKAWFLQ